MALPQHLPQCDPLARHFPLEWKEAFFRRHFDDAAGGYVCPDCHGVFSGPEGFRRLCADHKIPWSKGGLTEWDNMELRCAPCNIAKTDRLLDQPP